MRETQSEASVNDALRRACAHAPYLKLQSERFPEIAERLAAGDVEGAIAAAGEARSAAPTLAARLRHRRNALSLALAVADLAGAIPLERLMAALSDLADATLEEAIAAAIAERTPDAAPRGFAVIALGKHGSRELNFSSDIDPIFLFDPATLPCRPREEPGQAAVRIGQRLVELLQKREPEGFAFRVDLRLRPSSEVTPIALPVDAAISYYESSALPWERAAFIRARFAAGDAALGRYFLDAIHPFIWRRSLDFGAIGEIGSITRRIRGHHVRGQDFGPGYDLKRGRGGIREIEFFAQIHQLIHGGREPGLRAPATLDALAVLAEAGHVPEADAAALAGGYRLLRTIEHRLQMVEDRQTHSIPADADALDNVARLHGLAAGGDLLAALAPHVREAGRLYDGLAEEEEEGRLPLAADALEAQLAAAGFPDPASARARVEGWRTGKARSLRSPAAREAFEAMLPRLVEALGRAPDPMAALNRFDDVVARLPSGVNFFRLIEARPGLLAHLGDILSHAPTLADQLARRPQLLDGLIDATALAPMPPVAALAAEFGRAERTDEDYQLVLDRVRRRVNERRFAQGVQLVACAIDPIAAAEGYARIAEAAIQVLAAATVAAFAAAHGKVPGSELVILGLGRLGGEALTHASDLDLVYIFTGTHDAESDGPRPLRATDYFNRLAPRITAALSVPTPAGPLYDVDTRLRPSGADGMLAVSLEGFEQYQQGQAWTWEHMALLRARPVFGSQAGRTAVAATVDAVLRRPRDPARVAADAVRMRSEMGRHKPPAGPFDIKKAPGGLVDLEFAVQTLQLGRGIGLRPRLEEALAELAAAGLVPAEIDAGLRLLTRMLVMFRLVSPRAAAPPEATRPLVARACGLADWDSLLAAQAEARQRIAELWARVAAEAQGS
ncbi:MAG: bifunctional [glutamine synthetase] adenylyltransferase/[glutamine synthetase]-adenylyl-L-tyrosine phosphorylase [Alphaproteobacteria bacterium]|nr:bifunctional [glutamine synthetase] adenylyltransferase/[glutamine synthetase]-adenylyl-L-tyrosine phosphorylase [Alphaproteobacteria bacterium]